MGAFFARYRTYILIAIAVVMILVGWWMFAPDPSSDSLLTTQGVGEDGLDPGLVDTLLTLRAVTLSGTIFAEPAFAALLDFGTEIIPEPVGRENPFAPLSTKAATTEQSPLFPPKSTR